MNWNALEWDRAAEELTWERVSVTGAACLRSALASLGVDVPNKASHFLSVQMLGLDGSLVFLVGVLKLKRPHCAFGFNSCEGCRP